MLSQCEIEWLKAAETHENGMKLNWIVMRVREKEMKQRQRKTLSRKKYCNNSTATAKCANRIISHSNSSLWSNIDPIEKMTQNKYIQQCKFNP